MGLFSFGAQRRVVVTFSDTVLRAVTVAIQQGGIMRIVRSVEQRIPTGIIAGGIIEQPELFVECARAFSKKLPTSHVHMLVPQETALIVPLQRPYDDDDLKQYVQEQLETVLQQHSGPAAGYEVLSIVDDGSRLYIDVISASLLSTYKQLFKKAGLRVASWDTPHPDWTVVPEHQERSHVMVGVGDRSTSVVFLNGGVPVAQQVVPVGYADLVDTVRNVLNIQTHEAQKIIGRYGISVEHKEDRVLRALYDTVRPLEIEINAMIDAWQQKPYKNARERYPVASLLLHGEAYGLHGFHDRMSYATRIPAHHVDVAQSLGIAGVESVMSRDEMARFAPLLWKAHELVRS